MTAGAPGPGRTAAWRALAWFWVAALLVLGGGAAMLEYLGPPEMAPPAVAAAPPTRGEAASPAAAPEAVGAAVEPARTAAVAAAPPLPPTAPEPPPLPASATRLAVEPNQPIAPPDPALLEPGRSGAAPLPRVGPGGRTSIRTYARAFDRADTRPRAAVVVAGIGLSAAQTEDAIRRLPGAVGLALSPYAPRPDAVAERARARGMETLAGIAMEPAGFPLNDPGPNALLTSLPLVENLDRLDWALSRFAGHVGAIGALGGLRGERFAAAPELLGTVQDVLRTRGLLYIDPRPAGPAPQRAWGRTVDVVLDEPATRGEIERRLAELERLARARGAALGLAGDPTPVLVERVAAWAAGLEERGVVLAPVTAVIRRPEALPAAGAGDGAAVLPAAAAAATPAGRGAARP